MKITVGLVFAALVSLGQAQNDGSAPARCTSLRTRRNAATLSVQDWQNIANVVSRMSNDGWISRFGASHDRLFSRVHGNTCFFPFHRRYLVEYENIGRTYDPNFVLPYWDATQSARNPAADPLLNSNALGTNGQGANQSWYAPEIISSYLQSDTSLARFREDIEYSIHGAVHLGLGGDMNAGYAAQDFSFMVHHANLDRLWWDWQNSHNSFMMYDGTGSNGPASLSDAIPEDSSVPFNGASVESVMVLGYGNVCYTYDSSPSPPQSYPAAGNSAAPVNNNAASQPSQNNQQQPPQNNQQQPPQNNQQQPPQNNQQQQPQNNQQQQPQNNQQQQPQNNQQQWPSSNAPANRRPVLSGSSNMANRIMENSGIQGALGSDFVNRFFPGLRGWRAPSRRRAYQEKTLSDCGGPIPFPPRLTPEWIKMHGYDAERVEMFHQHACQIVEGLNNSTYTSPY
ncbi:hypothetical protein EV174_000929 [Coemansia sp. RSA 2320]|nr:hypothetical protein EV174_000929 [Coemansia sp. RSA 2320]